MVKKQIAIKISPSGNVEMEVLNAEGQECLALTEKIEQDLGVTSSRQLKSEFFEQEAAVEQSGPSET